MTKQIHPCVEEVAKLFWKREQPVQRLYGEKELQVQGAERPVWLECGEQGRKWHEKRSQVGES